MAGETKTVHGGYHVKLGGVPGAEGGLLFYSTTTPSATLESPDFKTWDAQNNPVNSLSAGQQVSWQPVTLSRGVDDNNELYQWFNDIKEQGADSQKKDLTISVFSPDGGQIETWNLVGAVLTDYGQSGLNAQTNEVLVENVTIKYEDATRE